MYDGLWKVFEYLAYAVGAVIWTILWMILLFGKKAGFWGKNYLSDYESIKDRIRYVPLQVSHRRLACKTCQERGEAGEMKFRKTKQKLWSNKALYTHLCDKCGNREDLTIIFPEVVYRTHPDHVGDK